MGQHDQCTHERPPRCVQSLLATGTKHEQYTMHALITCAYLQITEMSNHVSEQRVAGDIEWNTETLTKTERWHSELTYIAT